jgi:D-threo-aldose 1-dehydrogenase
MDRIALGTSGRHTTRLGFGCGSLMGATGRRDSLKLLESAYDAGIRHFDVAPMYGYGGAESCLGEFLQRHRADVTVTTKYGILPPRKTSLIGLGRRVAGPVIKRLPGIKQRLAKAVNSATRETERPAFTAVQAKASLERSLAALRTDRIDVWLLHEVVAGDLKDDSLLRLLEDLVQQGTVGTFGVGSSADKIPSLLAERSEYCGVLQYEWSAVEAPIQSSTAFRIHHRVLTENFRNLHKALVKDNAVCKRWSDATNMNLADADVLAHIMLRASLVMNPDSLILFSSKNPMHIQANVRVAADSSSDGSARRFYDLMRRERNQLFAHR